MTAVQNAAHQPDLISERRAFPRHNIQIPASIRLKDGRRIAGCTRDISSSGALFEFQDANPGEQETYGILTLFLDDKSSTEELKIKCIFKPAREKGAGLEFKTIATDDYIKFIFLLAKNYPDPEQLLTELKDNPGVQLLGET